MTVGRDILVTLSYYCNRDFSELLLNRASSFTMENQKSLQSEPLLSKLTSQKSETKSLSKVEVEFKIPVTEIFDRVAATLTTQKVTAVTTIKADESASSSDSESDDGASNLVNQNLHSIQKSIKKNQMKKNRKLLKAKRRISQSHVKVTQKEPTQTKR